MSEVGYGGGWRVSIRGETLVDLTSDLLPYADVYSLELSRELLPSVIKAPDRGLRDSNAGDFARTLKHQIYVSAAQLQTERGHFDTCGPVGLAGEKKKMCF